MEMLILLYGRDLGSQRIALTGKQKKELILKHEMQIYPKNSCCITALLLIK
jgi:hypothetical protein